ncbi:hypothetical protein PWT90_09399 [Aphanocladium album]|nr:hypothetical protein PWT90_09399 [Aphanocladium album]
MVPTPDNKETIWKVFLRWTKIKSRISPCEAHVRPLFICEQRARSIAFDAGFTAKGYIFCWLTLPLPSSSEELLEEREIGLLKFLSKAQDLVEVLAEVTIPTLDEDPECDCKKWMKADLAKLYPRAYITYEQYCEAVSAMEDCETRLVTS